MDDTDTFKHADMRKICKFWIIYISIAIFYEETSLNRLVFGLSFHFKTLTLKLWIFFFAGGWV
jgi:hypothetical protein